MKREGGVRSGLFANSVIGISEPLRGAEQDFLDHRRAGVGVDPDVHAGIIGCYPSRFAARYIQTMKALIGICVIKCCHARPGSVKARGDRDERRPRDERERVKIGDVVTMKGVTRRERV